MGSARDGDNSGDGNAARTPLRGRTVEDLRTTPRSRPGATPNTYRAAADPRTEPSRGAAPEARAIATRERHRPFRVLLTPLRWITVTIGALVPLVLLGLGLVYLKLLYGAVPLHFLVEPIRQALAAELDGLDVAVADAALHRNPNGGYEVRLTDLRLSAKTGDTAVRAAEAIVDLEPRALWSGHVAASRIVLVGPRLALSQDEARMPGFAAPSWPSASSPAPSEALPASGAGTPQARDSGERIDLARAVAEAMAHLRTSGDAASHLRTFGVRNATLEVEERGRRTIWLVPEMEVALDHLKRRSVISGQGRIAAGGVPFGVEFRLEEIGKAGALKLETRVEGLSLPALARNLPHLGLLAALDVPVTARGDMELTRDGHIVEGRFDVALGRGSLLPEALGGLAVGIEGGRLSFRYAGAEKRLTLAPSKLEFDGSWVRLEGDLTQVAAAGDALHGWQIDLASSEGALTATRDRAAIPIDALALRARLWPASGASELLSLVFKAGGAQLEARGTMIGGEERSATLEGRIGAMQADKIKAFWPAGVAGSARAAFLERLVAGKLNGGTFRVATVTGRATPAISLSLEAEGIALASVSGLAPVTVPRVLLAREDDRIEISIPEAHFAASPTRRASIKGGSIVITGLDRPVPVAEITGRGQTTIATLVEIAGRETVGLLAPGQAPAGADGKVDAQWRATVPVAEQIALADTKIEAKLRITDGRIPNVVGPHDVTGASFTIGATERAIDVKGELLVAGILAKAGGQWILGESHDRQSPFVVTTRLDGADRRRLGLGLDEEVLGEVPVEVQLAPASDEPGKVRVSADLTGAELQLGGLAWHKPTGRTARLSFEVVRPKGSRTLELQDFKLSGDSIAIDGTVSLGPDGQPIAYRFPGFSLNVVSNLEVEGVRRSDKVWDVKARGKTFDGGAIMRSLYAVETQRSTKSTGAMDLDARIDTLIGVNDTTVKHAHLVLRRRGDAIMGLEFKGLMDGGKPVEARLMPGPARVVQVDTTDAGQALKTIGFYTSMIGGVGTLRVHLDGRAGAERGGEIQVSKFRIQGDPIVSELVQGVDESQPAIATGKVRPARRVVREEIAFDMLRGSFASGNGQVAIEGLNAAGPMIGASVRGKMDFRSRSLSLGGTYVPLSGLNRALAGIPIFGEILTGPRGDGIIGITFAVDGPMASPNVIINPLSMVAPGVLREIFQMVPENPRVTPQEAIVTAPGGGPRVRSSQPETFRGGAAAPTQPRVLDGWSSKSQPPTGGR